MVDVAPSSGTANFWDTRPPWLVERIATSYDMISRSSFTGYNILASPDYAFGDLAASELLATCLADWEVAATAPDPVAAFRLLDIGAGEGRFMLAMRQRSPKLQVVGVSAQVYDKEVCCAPGMELRILNMECALNEPSKEMAGTCGEEMPFQEDLRRGMLYDLIVSAETFRHLQDPLGTVCLAFSLLREGGVLAVDRLHVPGLGDGQKLLDWLKLHVPGLEVHGEASGERIAPLFLRKRCQREVLRMPLRYVVNPVEGSDAVYEFVDGIEDTHSDGPRTGDIPPPWDRAGRATEVPLPQWRQVELILRQMVKP